MSEINKAARIEYLQSLYRDAEERCRNERERCAQIAESFPSMIAVGPSHVRGVTGKDIAAAIRAAESAQPQSRTEPASPPAQENDCG